MMKLIAVMALAFAASAQAQVGISREVLGSGRPEAGGFEQATPVLENDVFHAPQYMPYYPTAGVIYPRVIEVPCADDGGTIKCEGYHWTPKMGRGEYLFFTPKVVKPVESQVVLVPVEVPGPTRIILKEVPVKPKKE